MIILFFFNPRKFSGVIDLIIELDAGITRINQLTNKPVNQLTLLKISSIGNQ